MALEGEDLAPRTLGWRWHTAAGLFLLGFLGLLSGVEVSERPDLVADTWLAKAYYTLGLFVVGGLDLGTPQNGPLLGRIALWLAYFGAPLLTASAVIEAVIRVVSPNRWRLRRLRDHIVISGANVLTLSYLRVLRGRDQTTQVVVVADGTDLLREQEIQQRFGATVVHGDVAEEFLLSRLRLGRARRVMLFGDNDFQSFEAASRILARRPGLAGRIVLHCQRLRFLRAMQDTELLRSCESFNAYHLAAAGLVRDQLSEHFRSTAERDVVVVAGFGRFGQTILEELERRTEDELDQVCVIDTDAERRMLVVEEQKRLSSKYERLVLQGDISHPDIWFRLRERIDLGKGEPVVILGTGDSENNLRTGLWLKALYPNLVLFVRTNGKSKFAEDLGAEHGIHNISLTQLVEDYVPEVWLR
ncbi:MAG: NAD-binding protein [Pseudomonadota bacterium]